MIRCIGNFGDYKKKKTEGKEVVIKKFILLRQDHYKIVLSLDKKPA